jgi:DNA-directed RNA polymerase specialized sigma24 family protein
MLHRRSEEREAFDRALVDVPDAFTAEERATAEAVFLEGRTVRAAAEQLGVSRHVAQYRTDGARRTLRAWLRGELPLRLRTPLLEDRAERQAFARAFDVAPEVFTTAEREAVSTVLIEGQSLAAASRRLGESPATLQVRVDTARDVLRQWLRRFGPAQLSIRSTARKRTLPLIMRS